MKSRSKVSASASVHRKLISGFDYQYGDPYEMESKNADIAVDLLKDPYADLQLKSRAKFTSVNAPIVFVKQTKIAAISIPYNLFKHEVGNISDEVAIVKGAITIVISSSDVK